MKPIAYCKDYKYLGVNINVHIDFKFTVEKPSDSAGRALGAIVTGPLLAGFGMNVRLWLCSTPNHVKMQT